MTLFNFFKRKSPESEQALLTSEPFASSDLPLDDSFSADMAATRRTEEAEFRVAAKRELARLYHRVHNATHYPFAPPINVDYSKLQFPPGFWKKEKS